MATPMYDDVLAEVKKLPLDEQQKLAKEVAAQFKKKPRATKAAADGVDASSPAEEKPKRTLSEEQKAKMKAGREAARAKKAAEKETDGAAAAPAEEKPAKPKRVLSEEQKAKMKAGREAAKARKAGVVAEEVKPAEAQIHPNSASVEEEDEVPVQMVNWEHDFGEGSKTYKRLDYEGRTYIYNHETRVYLGAYVEKTNKLKKLPDPLVGEEDE